MIDLPKGDLDRTISHEPEQNWPTIIEIVAYWGEGRRGRRRSVEIPAERFFGRKSAPMTGDELISIVDRLRRMGPRK